MTKWEYEVIVLKAVTDIIEEMVNHEVMCLLGSDPHTEIRFETMTHMRYFNIILVDFLSMTDKNGPIEQTSYIQGLRTVLDNPHFDVNDSVASLSTAVNDFKSWLEEEVKVEVYLPSIDKEVLLQLSRFKYIKMTGDLSKHHSLRAVGVAKDLGKLIKKSGISIDDNVSLLALPDFYERFHTDILAYHSSTIAEFLNDIRWGIQKYLTPEFERSYQVNNDDLYSYKYLVPTEILSGFAETSYWDLMNSVRRKPYFRKFEVNKWLKKRY